MKRATNWFRYTARQFDSSTGLYFYRVRYYDPTAGRFISEDSLRFASGEANFYGYVGNNPVNLFDPQGLAPSCKDKRDCPPALKQALYAALIAEYQNGAPPSSPSKEYIYFGTQLLATIAGTTITYHHHDHLSVRVNTDSFGNKVGEQGHFPFGELWYATNTTTKWFFTSYERDFETGGSDLGNDYALGRTDIHRDASPPPTQWLALSPIPRA